MMMHNCETTRCGYHNDLSRSTEDLSLFLHPTQPGPHPHCTLDLARQRASKSSRWMVKFKKGGGVKGKYTRHYKDAATIPKKELGVKTEIDTTIAEL